MNASEQNKPNQQERVIPKLRFPEFQTALGWSWKTLDQVCTITNGKSNAQDHIENGKYPLFDRSEIIKASNDYLFDCEVVIIPGEGMKFIPKYYKGKFNLHQRAYALKDFIINGKFVYYSMLNNTTLLSKKAVQSTVLSLRLPILKNFPIIKPETEEQQKIADCLSSLDELIELQEQKLVALKQHKKGLMQQLFPSHNDLQAGSVVYPKLRFPQFRNCKGWEVVELKVLANRVTVKNKDNAIIRVLTNSANDGVIDQGDYFDRDIANKNNLDGYYIIEFGDYVYNPRISNLAPVGPISKNKVGIGVMSPLYTVFRFKNEQNDFYEYFFKTNTWHKYLQQNSNSGARYDRMNITNNDFMSMPLPMLIPKEQQAIADCLSSLDNLISEQSEQIGRLKTHKKGLMQQLFPST
ncbi:restriction endonuclease subunit S [Glaesserella parasuis]|nr:restriction endonuclease subunit S [Glaesserella parasuis]